MLNLMALRQVIAGRLLTAVSADPVPEGSVIEAPVLAERAAAPERAPTAPPAARPHGRPALPMRRIVTQAAAMWLATRIAYALFTYFVVMFQHANSAQEFIHTGPHVLLASWQRWDAIWYIHIAQNGYFSDQATAFFPLYPLLIRGTTLLIGQHWILAAMLVSNLGSLVAFIGVGLLAAGEDGSETSAWRAIRVMVAYPLAFFLVAPYTEGLFLGFSALALYAARRGTWGWAAVWAFLAGLTRPTGIILIPALAWELGRQRGWWRNAWAALRDLRQPAARAILSARIRMFAYPVTWQAGWDAARARWRSGAERRTWAYWRAGRWRDDSSRRALAQGGLAVAGVPSAILAYMFVLELRFRHPLLWLHVQTIFWRRDSMPVISAVGGAVGQFFDMPPWTYWQARELVDLAPVLIFGLLTLIAIRKQPFAFTIFMAGLLYLAVSSPVLDTPDPDMLISAGRFFVVAAPIFVLLGRWTERRPWLDLLLVSGGFLIQAVLAGFFLANGWLI